MEQVKSIVVSAFIRNSAGKYLVVFDPKLSFWRVPGGRMEFNERPEETLKREAQEELSLDIEVGKFLGFGQDRVIVRNERDAWRTILYFEVKPLSEDLKPDPGEIAEFKWGTVEELQQLDPLEPAIKDLFKRFKPSL